MTCSGKENGTGTFSRLDPKGNLTRDEEGQQYTWDFNNKLTEARNSDGDLLGTYVYDALGRRVTKTVHPTSGASGGGGGMTAITTAFVHLTSGGGMGQLLAGGKKRDRYVFDVGGCVR